MEKYTKRRNVILGKAFFRNKPQHKNANFVLAVPLEITVLMEKTTSKCNSLIPTDI